MTRLFEITMIALAIMVLAVAVESRAAESELPDVAGIVRPAEACDCVTWSIEALHYVRIRLKTIPSIGVNDWFKHPGSYSRGVVNVRDINNCRVLLHEFAHHYQWERDGDAKDTHENWRREMEAAFITTRAESEMETCQ